MNSNQQSKDVHIDSGTGEQTNRKPEIGTLGSTQEIRRYLSLLEMPVEMRIPFSKGRTISGYYDDLDQLVKVCEYYSGRKAANRLPKVAGVYTTLNRFNPDLLSRYYNRVEDFAKYTTCDTNIIQRRWLPVDVDAVRLAGISATEAEKKKALGCARSISEYLKDAGFPPGLLGDSGNGGHILWRVDLPNTNEVRDAFKELLEHLAKRFDSDGAKVDLTVFNASRIWKVYGTKVCKGDDVGDRRHRFAHLLDVPNDLETVPLELIRKILSKETNPSTSLPNHEPLPATNGVANETPRGNLTEPVAGENDVTEWCEAHGLSVKNTGDYKGDVKFVLAACPFTSSHSSGDPSGAAIFQKPNGRIWFKCYHTSCKGKRWRDVLAHFGEYVDEVEKHGDKVRDEMEARLDALFASLPDVESPAPGTTTHKRRGYLIRELNSLPAIRWQVEKHIPSGGFCTIFGPPGSAKSFFAIDLAMSVATGKKFLDQYPVIQGPVCYVVAEGHPGIRKRIDAWLSFYQMGIPDNFVVIPASFDLLNASEAAEVLKIACEQLGTVPELFVFDTLARMFGVGDENATKDMNTYIRNASMLSSSIFQRTGKLSTILNIHHTGKDVARKERGNSSLRGACDTMIEMEGTPENGVKVSLDKTKDIGKVSQYLLKQNLIAIPYDPDGSLVLLQEGQWSLPLRQLTRDQRSFLSQIKKKYGLDKFVRKDAVSLHIACDKQKKEADASARGLEPEKTVATSTAGDRFDRLADAKLLHLDDTRKYHINPEVYDLIVE